MRFAPPAPHWTLLQTCRQLFLGGFEVQARIGVHDFERKEPQRLILDVQLYCPLHLSTPREDALHEVIDYDFIRQTIYSKIERSHINLQETLVDDILQTLLEHPGVTAASVSSYKPDVYPDCQGVGVSVFKSKSGALPC